MKYIEKSRTISTLFTNFTPPLLAGLLLFGMVANVQAAPKDVEAGPIWNQADAEKKCPALAKKHNLRWTGQWRTTIQGKMSVCGLEPLANAKPQKFSGYYKFQTKFLEKENKCLEGNKFAPSSTLKGAAFMDNCQNVSGQFWKLEPANNGYYRLKTMFLEKENKCLEGNKVASKSTLGGAAFMDNCQNVSGQLWKPVPAGKGYYRLKTMFLEKENKCLEGNKFAPSSTLKGAAFMDTCQNVSGQLWKFVKVRN